ncbi:MAG: 30S ribosome-binding factor RbfA [Ignavibacteriae bacterium]|nr:MAG: 30S ribosome-binding factor RbfA [Ignavibacteriota bacterium]
MSIRSEKVSEEIKHQINSVLTKDLTDINAGLVTVTNVIMSRDLKTAKIYLSFLGNKETPEKIIEKVNLRKKQIRMHLGSKVYLKNVPELFFYHDDTMEYASKIDELIKKIHTNDNDEV